MPSTVEQQTEQHNAYQESLDTVRTITTVVNVNNRRGSLGSIADRAVKTANLLKEGFVFGNTTSFSEGNSTVIVDTLYRATKQANEEATGVELLEAQDEHDVNIFNEEATRHAMIASARHGIPVPSVVQRALKIANLLDNLVETGHTVSAINANDEIIGNINISVVPQP
jgi:hypothetical protein